MLVKNILLFIEQLDTFAPLQPYDSSLRSSLFNRFHYQNADKLIDHRDVEFIENCYKERAKKTLDTVTDCLLNSDDINQLWIKFAEEIAVFAQKKYYQILFPNITNTIDFNNHTPLEETARPVNFYLGHGGKTLYRKRGLCEHLIKNEFMLSTYRDFPQSKLSALTVEELTRLKFCTRTNSYFMINDESFTSFWDFLEKKSFPRLKERGKIPLYLLPHFLSLIEQYYKSKTAQADYDLFKKAATIFFDLLSTGKLVNINYFYGLRIFYQDREYYLLDFLIAINKSQHYELDDVFNSLLIWLYQINPALKSTLPVLDSVYASLDAHGSSASTSSCLLTSTPNDKLHQCYALIVSLLTTSFEIWPFTAGTISLWDRKNRVFPEAVVIFQYFFYALNQNRSEDLLTIYSEIYETYFNPAPLELDLFSWLTQIHSITRWYQLVGQGKLSKIDVHWYEPELLLHSLLHFKPSSKCVSTYINLFLDELVHTYSQSSNDLLKRFRVNILFTDLLKKMDQSDKTNLKILLQLYPLEEASSKFLDNCAQHIGSRLASLSVNHPGGALHFYTVVQKPKSSTLVLSSSEFHQVSGIIDAFKVALGSPTIKIAPKLLEQMVTFLRSLSRPILTVGEIEGAQNSAQVADYLCSPT
jgi:hypothetical protein